MYRIYFLVSFFICVQSCSDHYWRDYDGRIPPDAIIGGHNNITNCPSYIGQVYGHNHGLAAGTINPGSMEIIAAFHGVVKTNVVIKILCAPDPSKYVWVPTTAATFMEDMEGEMPVIGGYDQTGYTGGSPGTLNIGRIRVDDRDIVGIVATFYKTNILFYYPLKGKALQDTQYEVLVYRDDSNKKKCG